METASRNGGPGQRGAATELIDRSHKWPPSQRGQRLFFIDDYCRVLSILSACGGEARLQKIQQPQSELTNPPVANVSPHEFIIDDAESVYLVAEWPLL